jgi:hypothetical protein
MVTVAYDGWGRIYDEKLEWPNERLAKLYTYSKKVKCFADLLRAPKTKPLKHLRDTLPKGAHKGYCTSWPCSVEFRMPHPGNPGPGENGLRLEERIFVQPYGVDLLPESARALILEDGGTWLHHSRLRQWKDDLNMLGVLLTPNMLKAYQIGKNDTSVKGYLVPHALIPKTTLLDDVYRVFGIQGADVRDGALVPTNPPSRPVSLKRMKVEKPPAIVRVRPMEEESKIENKGDDDGVSNRKLFVSGFH